MNQDARLCPVCNEPAYAVQARTAELPPRNGARIYAVVGTVFYHTDKYCDEEVREMVELPVPVRRTISMYNPA